MDNSTTTSQDVSQISDFQAYVSNMAGIVSAAVALFAALVVLGISLVLYIDTRTRPHVTSRLSFRLILLSLVSSVLYDVFYIISDVLTGGFWCGASVWGIVFFQLFSNFLVACIAINVVVVMSSMHLFASRDTWLQWYYIGGSFLLAAGASVIPIPGGHYGWEPLEQTCWFVVLGDQPHSLVYSLSSLFVWQLLVALICLVCVVFVVWRAMMSQKIVQSNTVVSTTRRSMLGPRSTEMKSRDVTSSAAHDTDETPLGPSTIRLSDAPKVKLGPHKSVRLARNSVGRAAGGTRSENDARRQSASYEMDSRKSYTSYDHDKVIHSPRSPTGIPRKTANEYFSELMTNEEAILTPEELLPTTSFTLPSRDPLSPPQPAGSSPRTQHRWSKWISPTTSQDSTHSQSKNLFHTTQHSAPAPIPQKDEPRVFVVRSKSRRIIRRVALRVMLYPGALFLFSVWEPISDLFTAATDQFNFPIYMMAFLTGGGAGLAYAIIALVADPSFVKGTKAWWAIHFGRKVPSAISDFETGPSTSDYSDQERKRVVAAM